MSAVIKLSAPATHGFWEIPVLFEDEHLLALDKPAGLLTSPDRYDAERPNLMKLLHAGITAGKPWVRERNLTYLSNAHRLDFETSGIILLAKSKPVLVALADQFGAEKPQKKYLAIVQGVPAEDQFTVEEKISPHPIKTGMMRVDSKGGKRSKTDFEVLEKFSKWSVLRCLPRTGRTHQIRIHLKHAGFPIVADELYGGKPFWLSRIKRDYRLKDGKEERPLIARVALHAEELIVDHPVNRQPVAIKSEWPKDMRVTVKYLRQFASGPQSSHSDFSDFEE